MKRVVGLVVVAGLVALAWTYISDPAAAPPQALITSAHSRHAAFLRLQSLFRSDRAASEWLRLADSTVAEAQATSLPLSVESTFSAVDAAAWRFRVRRGQRIVTDATFERSPAFIDVVRAGGGLPLASAGRGASHVEYDAREDSDLVVRVQPPLNHPGAYRIVARLEPSLRFPVRGIDPGSVQSSFGGPRDAGRRKHAGIDIFAPRGTPVLAAADGWVTGSTMNGLGGNVVWVWSPLRQMTTYYAHLDRHQVAPGDRVRAGDVVGYVGTTGNARGTPPHLHFGVYVWHVGAVDPLPYVRDLTIRNTHEKRNLRTKTRSRTRSGSPVGTATPTQAP